MASIGKEAGGTRRILFCAPDGKRKTIRLGKVTQRQAEAVCVRVEALAAAQFTNAAPDPETSRWLGDIEPALYDKLAAVGLVAARDAQAGERLGAWVERFIQSRTDVKPRTLIVYRQAVKSLLEFFGPDHDLKALTVGSMEDWQRFMIGQGLAENTHRKRAGCAKLFLNAAVKHGILRKNPAETLKSHLVVVPERQQYISRTEIEAVLEQADLEWKAIITLVRFMALRCPSELLEVRWSDINWQTGRLLVRSPKTERHGKSQRIVPLVPEVRAALSALWDSLPEGSSDLVFNRHASRKGNQANLRTHLNRLFNRAGLSAPQKPFHNLRSSCVTDWSETLPSHAVCDFAGHTEAVSMLHYRQTHEEHFQRLSKPTNSAAQNPAQYTSEPGGMAGKRNSGTLGFPEDSAVFRSVAGKSYTPLGSNQQPSVP